MPFSFIIPAVASIGSALIGSNAAQDAANTQSQSQQAALNQQQAMFDQQQKNQQPYLNAGYTALNTLGTGTTGGINQGQFTTAPGTYNPIETQKFQTFNPIATQNFQTYQPTQTQQFQTYKPVTNADIMANLAPNYQFMLNQGLGATAMGANASGGGSNIDRANQIFAENYAGNAYQNALQNYMGQQAQGFNQAQTQQQNTIANALAQQGQGFNQNITQQQNAIANAINQSNTGFTQNTTQQQNAIANALAQQQQQYAQTTGNQTNIFNRLAALAGIGQSSANVGTQAAVSALSPIGSTIGNIGTAQAAGQIGSANAISGGLTNAGNYSYLSSLLNPSQNNAGANTGGGGYFGGIGGSSSGETNPYSLLG